jgi:hypothetical protein
MLIIRLPTTLAAAPERYSVEYSEKSNGLKWKK